MFQEDTTGTWFLNLMTVRAIHIRIPPERGPEFRVEAHFQGGLVYCLSNAKTYEEAHDYARALMAQLNLDRSSQDEG